MNELLYAALFILFFLSGVGLLATALYAFSTWCLWQAAADKLDRMQSFKAAWSFGPVRVAFAVGV